MINSKVDHCTTLKEFYSEIRKQQVEAHGEGYCDQHDALQKYLKDCRVYKELGTHQGASAAAACLVNPEQVHLVDIDFTKFRASKSLFDSYCSDNGISLFLYEMSSLDPRCKSASDVLLIDSVHKPIWLMQELILHAPTVRKYIIMHDTHILLGKIDPSLYNTALDFATKTKEWEVVEHHPINAGYTVLGRI
jgi:hypothetical protein